MSLEPIELTTEFETSKLIFLHHIDDFEMNAIKKHLMEENIKTGGLKYKIFGCMNQQENIVKVMHDRHPLEIFNSANDNYFQKILNCDILVFNVNSINFEKVCSDMRRLMRELEELHKKQNKISVLSKFLILISTPMTWALTPTINSNQGNNEVEKDIILEEDYRHRKAHKKYCHHKLLERDVIWLQKKCKDFVRTLVICPGVTYGSENHSFHHIFKFAFYNQPVPIIGNGTQLIPMIYIKDFVRIMQNIFDNFPESKIRYILAVQPVLMPLKHFTYKICKAFNEDCSKVLFHQDLEMLKDKEHFSQTILDLQSLNLKMGLTSLKGFEFHEVADGLWYTLAEEFRIARNLHPIKIIIDGPPLVGKTEHAQNLSDYYQIPYIDTYQIIEIYIQFLEEKINDSTMFLKNFESLTFETDQVEETKCELSVERKYFSQTDQTDQEIIEYLKKKFEEWSKEKLELKMYLASHKDFENQDFEKISCCLIALISNNQYNINQGYILDNFSFTYDEANTIFYNTRKFENYHYETSHAGDNVAFISSLKPTHAVIFDAPDEIICQKAMSFTETEAIDRRCLRHQLLPRLEAYREKNEGSQCLANIFYDNDLIPISIHLDHDSEVVETLQAFKNEIGLPFTYPLSSTQQKALSDMKSEKRLKEKEDECRKKEELLKSLTVERELKFQEWTKKYEEIRKHANELHEIKTLPLRQYLGKYVLPALTEGIMKVAEIKPDDPVDFLAEYLFNCNPEGQRVPPFCTKEQKTRFENSFHEDLTSSSIDFYNMVEPECDGYHDK